MPKDLQNQSVNLGEVIFNWRIGEYEKYERGKRWYILMILLAAVLVALAVFSANYLFALIIVLFVIILFLQEMNEPIVLDFAVCETGLIVGSKYYSFSELEKFWIIYNPPEIKKVYFEPKGILKHRFSIPMDDVDPVALRTFLSQYVMEDLEKEEEPLSDRLGRLLKIQ